MGATWWTRRSDERVNLVFYEQSDDIPGSDFTVARRVQRHETATPQNASINCITHIYAQPIYNGVK